MRLKPYRIAAVVVLWTGLAGVCLAQSQSSGAQNRRDELAKVQEELADPDPAQRLANLEAIVQQGDPLRIQTALRTALASDDAEMRGLAMQAVLAITSELTFEIVPPYGDSGDAAPPGRREASGGERYVRGMLGKAGHRIRLVIKEYRFPAATGTVEVMPNRPAPFVIRGRRFSAQVSVSFGKCYVDFAPSRKLELEGTLACEGAAWPKLAIHSALF